MSNLTLFTVIADKETGQWLTEPKQIGTCDSNNPPAETYFVHYDTFERTGHDENGEEYTETCGILVQWE